MEMRNAIAIIDEYRAVIGVPYLEALIEMRADFENGYLNYDQALAYRVFMAAGRELFKEIEMAKLNKIEKKVENQVEAMFYKLAFGVQFDIFDLCKVGKDAKKILLAVGDDGLEDAEMAMIEAIAQYRVN